MKHTPGPWKGANNIQPEWTRAHIYAGTEGTSTMNSICDVIVNKSGKETEQKGNARLISNIPIMYKALLEISQCKLKEEGGRLDKHDAAGFIRIARNALKETL